MTNQANNMSKCGMVSIVGRPNVGKSTLLNRIVGEKVAIVSKVPQTTRNRIRGVYSDERGQIIFIDTPGLVLGKDKLDRMLKKASFGTMAEVDCIIHVVDARDKVGEEEHAIVERLKDVPCPVILALNKVDQKPKYMDEYIKLWEEVKGKPVTELSSFIMITISGKKGKNIDQLLDILFDHLPTGEPLYPIDTVCDVSQKMVVADIIREKLLGILADEVPHSVAVVVESMEPKRKGITHIQAQILVERDSQKEIVIGKGGWVLKKVGTLARKELQELLGGKVFLETHVKLQKKWRDNLRILQELGYDPSQ